MIGKPIFFHSERKEVYWVPGHVAGSPLIGPEPFCGITESHIKKEIKKLEEDNRAEHWNDLPKMRQAKLLLGTFNTKRYKDVIKLNRNNVRMLGGFLTGHCRLRKHLKVLGIESDDQCRFCNEQEESPDHLLGDCEALIHQSKKYLGSYYVEEKELKLLSVTEILSFIRGTNLDEVL